MRICRKRVHTELYNLGLTPETGQAIFGSLQILLKISPWV